jgi:UDP-glucuronate decarboxylase
MHQNDGRVVSNFIVQALQGRDITIYGEGLQTRSFCYVSDLIQGMTLMMSSNKSIQGPINLGNPREFTIKSLAEKIIEMTGSKSKLVFQDLPSDDPKQRRPDISKAQNLLNWTPQIEIEEGLMKTVEYFKTILKE